MAGSVLVTGASGFVGSAVVEELLTGGYSVRALVNRRAPDFPAGRVTPVRGGLFEPRALDEAMRGCDAVIHLVGIIMEDPARGITFRRIHFDGTRAVVDAARRMGVRRYVQMSALGARADAPAEYHRTKFLAEQYVRAGGMEWTIVRPSMIHGPKGEFMRMEAGWARGNKPPFLFMPYFGAGLFGTRGAGKLQPVHVNDVARTFVDCLAGHRTVGEVIPVGGPEQFTWPQMHRIAAGVIVGKRRPVVALPAWYAKLLTSILPARALPFNRDQVIMSQEDNVCDLSKFKALMGWEPRGFEESLRGYVGQL